MRVFHVQPRHGESLFVTDDGSGVYEVRSNVGRRGSPIQRGGGAPHDLLKHYEGGKLEPCELGTGEHYVRIYRPHAPLVGKHYQREWSNTVQSVRTLLAGLRDTFRVVEPVPSNFQVYGHQLRQLLILACNEVESSCRAVLKANAYPKPTESMTMLDYVTLAGPMRLKEWEVGLSNHPDLPPFRPFESWDPAEPTKSLPWYQKQHGVKHNREELFADATLENAIYALGAAFVLVHAQFGHFGRASFNHYEIDDFSVTSKPTWRLSEHYVHPHIDGMDHGEWKGKPYPFVPPPKPAKRRRRRGG
jgi:hypothetical protein